MKKKLLSGVKPTGNIHIGNYFGAMKQFVDLQNDYESFIFIADYHALNQVKNCRILSQNILEIAKAYLSIGLNPQKVVLFKQSDVPLVTELCWIFNSLTPMGLLQRAHAYKDAQAKKIPIDMGLFDYPVLMAADILMYNADVVPVGEDQKQHLEIAQEIARLFNNYYGETFKIPSALIDEGMAVIKGTDGRKMSKSYDNTIGLFDSRKEVAEKIMSIVTDSRAADEPKDPETCNIFALHKLFSKFQIDLLKTRYQEGSISYKESKEILIDNLNNFLDPIRLKKKELDDNPKFVFDVLARGAEIATKVATVKMEQVRQKIGVRISL